MKKKVCLTLVGLLLVLGAFAQQNAVYTIGLYYDYYEVEVGCEACDTNYQSYPYVGLESSNGGTIDDIYITNEESLDLTYYERRNYNYRTINQPNGVNYCTNYSLEDGFTNASTDWCSARKNIENRFIELGESVEYGNANSENLDIFWYDQLKSYAKSWLLAYEPNAEPNNPISRYYSEYLFEREGVQVDDGYWEYLVQGNSDWQPINDNQVQSLFPLNITAEELDDILPEDLESLGNIYLRFNLYAQGTGKYIDFQGNITSQPKSETKNIGFYSFEITKSPPALDSQINPNPIPSPTTCHGGLDGGFTITFDRVLTDEEKMIIYVHRKTGDNTYADDAEDSSGELWAEHLDDKTFHFEGISLNADTYGIKWMVGPISENESDVVESDFVDIVISEPSAVSISDSEITDITCQGSNDGEITIDTSGGSPPYTYAWKKNGNQFALPQGSTNTHLVNLLEGTYTVIITDSHNCNFESEEFVVEVLNTNPELDAYVAAQPGTSPNYLPTGSILIQSIIGGSGNYILHWKKNGEEYLPQDSYNLNELESGTYTLIIEDSETGCLSQTEEIQIIELEPLAVEVTETAGITCKGDIGILKANPSGGTNGGYEYLWSTGETTQSINAGQGEYSVTVTDNGDSEVEEFYEFDYTNPLLTVNVNKIDVLCKDEATGSIELDISGGTGGPYSVSWLDTQGDGSLRTDLEAGEYIYFISDGECEVTNENEPIVIDEPEGFFTVEKISQINVSLNGKDDGALEITLENGLPQYTFNWTKDNQPYEPTAKSTDTSLVGLEAGIYQVVVTDALGCQTTLDAPAHISEPDSLAIVEMNTIDVNCKGGFTGSITANVTGIPPFTYMWKKQGDVSFTAPNQRTISRLSSGTYILSVSDNSIASEVTEVVVINEPDEELTVTIIPNITECFLGNIGNIQISTSGGVAPYQYSINQGADFQEEPIFDGLESGTYEVLVLDANQCEFQTSVVLGQPDQTNAEFAMSSQVVAGENVLAVDLSYPVPDELEWVVPEEAIVLNKNSDELEIVFNQPGEYEVGVLAYRGDCLSTETKKILVLEGGEIVQGAPEADTSKKIEYFIIYPNPTTGRFNAGIQLGDLSNISLKIFGLANNNLIGEEQAFGKENYDIPMDLTGLPSGLYVIVLETQFGISIQKLILY